MTAVPVINATVLPWLVGAGVLLGCVQVSYEANPEFCTNAFGDQTCAEHFPDGSRPYCVIDECLDANYGCLDHEPSPECASPCGRENPNCEAGMTMGSSSGSGSDSGTDSGATESSGGSTTTGPQPCMGDGDCVDGTAPFCEPTLGECVGCDGMPEPDMACAGLEAGTPVCVDGECRQCTAAAPEECTGDTPVCDEETSTCVPCTGHEQCGSGACELAVGRCFPDGSAVTVDVDGGADYPSVVLAMASVADGAHGVIVVHDRDDGLGYQGALVDGGKTVAVLAAPGEAPIIQGTGGNPGLRVEGAGTILYMDELSIAGNTAGLGMTIDGAYAWIDRSRIVQNSGGGVLAQNGGELVLRNSFVGRNGDEFSDTRGLTMAGAILTVVYSTIAANDGNEATGPVSISCDAGTSGDVRNSIVAAGTDTIDCSNVSFDNNVVDTSGLAGSNNDVLPFESAWFPNIAVSDFHIEMGPPFADVAAWQSGDPVVDIDGELRPSVDGTADYAGADLVP